jgi:hypothetical protein
MKGKLVFIKEHECETLVKTNLVSITYYDNQSNKSWYWCFDNKLHGIAYCPYCGADLRKENSND